MSKTHSNDSALNIQSKWLKALQEGDETQVKHLISEGISVFTKDLQGRSVLHYAALNNNLEMAKIAIHHGALIVDFDVHQLTPLHLAAQYNALEVAELLLLSRGISVNTTNRSGLTPIMLAAWQGHLDMVLLLIRWNADDEIKSKDGLCAVHYAAWNGYMQILDLLEEGGRNLFVRTSKGLDITDIAKMRSHDAILSKHLDADDVPPSPQSINWTLQENESKLPYLLEGNFSKNTHSFIDTSKKNHQVSPQKRDEKTEDFISFGTEEQARREDEKLEKSLRKPLEESRTLNDFEYQNTPEPEKESAIKTNHLWMKEEESFIPKEPPKPIPEAPRNSPIHLPTDVYELNEKKIEKVYQELDIPSFKPKNYQEDSSFPSESHDPISKGAEELKINLLSGIQLDAHQAQPIENDEYQPEGSLVYRAIDGQYCSSATEMLIFSFFYLLNVEFQYRRTMTGTVTPGQQTPTFTIFDRNGNVIVWVVLPYNPDDDEHHSNWSRTLLWYQNNGFNYDLNFLMSYVEDEGRGIDSIALYNKTLFIKQQL